MGYQFQSLGVFNQSIVYNVVTTSFTSGQSFFTSCIVATLPVKPSCSV